MSDRGELAVSEGVGLVLSEEMKEEIDEKEGAPAVLRRDLQAWTRSRPTLALA